MLCPGFSDCCISKASGRLRLRRLMQNVQADITMQFATHQALINSDQKRRSDDIETRIATTPRTPGY